MSDEEENTRKEGGNSDAEGMRAGRGGEEAMEERRAASEQTDDCPRCPKIYSTQDIARLMQMHPDTIYRKLRNGELPKPLPFSRLLRWNGYLFDKWVEDGCPRGKAGKKKGAADGTCSDAGKKDGKAKGKNKGGPRSGS